MPRPKLFTSITKERHHPLVGLLTRQTVLRVQGDGATPLVVHVDHLAQAGVWRHLAHLRARGSQTEVRLHLHHAQLDRAVTENLQHQCAVELDVALHQHARSGHLTQQLTHRRRIGPRLGIGGATRQDVLPGIGQAHQHAANGQAFKNEFMEFRQSSINGRVGPILKS